MTVDQFVSVY